MTAIENQLKAPFPYFGGKSRVAGVVWRALGDPKHYIEPFCGSAAVLLARPPSQPTDARCRNEIIGDLDCYLVNFWRALKADPDGVAGYARHLNSQNDHLARHTYLLDSRIGLREKTKSDPEYYDAKCAGYWVFGISRWIGSGWTRESYRGTNKKQELMSRRGVFSGCRDDLLGLFHELSQRLGKVRVVNSSWEQTCTTPTMLDDDCGIFFDPPYSAEAGRSEEIYAVENLTVSHEVRRWCIDHQQQCKIVLAGYIGEHDELESHGWKVFSWANGGGWYGTAKDKNSRGKSNRHKERLWISPLCGGIE